LNARPKNTILVSPVGDLDLDSEFLHELCDKISEIFGCETEIMPLLKEIDFARDPVRDQHHSTLLLERLSALAPHRVLKVLAITTVDLFIPVLTYVYGEAQLGGKSSIISTYRLQETHSAKVTPATYQCRILKEAIHELGHTFGLRHCPNESCIMHYCRKIQDVDRKSTELCRYCKVLLSDEMKRLASE